MITEHLLSDPRPRSTIIFDADGTLIGGEPTDWASFEAAFLEVAGFALTSEFYDRIEEVTAKALVHQALADIEYEERLLKEQAVAEGFLRRLKSAHSEDRACFPAVEGAVALLHELKAAGLRVAIATGDWRESITFKLRAAGVPFEDIPIVTSSEHYSRADIIRAAVTEAGGSLDEAVYVGDGLWDLRACVRLGIPFIGVGHRKERLRKAGALHVLDDLRPAEFWRVRDILHAAST
ncbi:MAG: HAD hydrolase-like protein [Prosthecobacter sp.]|jgi:phosphoglycolate phosphatase-like HAD superfamily hydrolase|uniref:HAD family hydrolase n=1 Tax=Prosthecobacter sp. TaxID=1965333 RepID=UPI001A05F326|nr:HAD hydrolase-like protein [Prosthecobacter sp.]MBE2285466.1 HAD hydrolase-like protein [Prosthecobacter sp.]